MKFFWRAMITNMDSWVRNNTAPPESSYPKIANRTLVPLDRYTFPAIPDVHVPHNVTKAWRLDFGPNWRNGVLTKQPPDVGQAFPVLVPQVNADGNETDGVRLPEITVPLATYTGWNLRDPSIGAPDQRVSFEGSFIPLPRMKDERERTGDPRLSIAERYPSREEYLSRVNQAIEELVKQRWILDEDRAALAALAEEEWSAATKEPSTIY